MARKKQRIKLENLTVIDTSSDGKGIAKTDNKVIFIKDAIPGDVVDVMVYRKKKNYSEANLEKIISPSENRIEPFCSHFGVCGGCKWQSMKYETQLFYKQKMVLDAFERIAKLDFPKPEPILGSKQIQHYRNKLDFSFSTSRWLTFQQMDENPELKGQAALGFHVPKRFDKIVQIETCYLQADLNNKIRLEIDDFCRSNDYSFYDLRNHTGLMRNLIIRNTIAGEWMVIVVFGNNNEPEKIENLMNHLKKKFPEITSLNYVINEKLNDTIYDQEVILHHGENFITEHFGDLKYKISPKSFFQTNPAQAKVLYELVAKYADLSGNELVFDLYTGTGSIAIFLAQQAKKVIGIESVEDAIVDAKKNAELNEIENCEFHSGIMEKFLTDEFISQKGKPDVIITDPPRAGMHPKVVEMLLKVKAPKIVYVSCNPSTQARDLELMKGVYKINKFQTVDMFPHTSHVENVALLELI